MIKNASVRQRYRATSGVFLVSVIVTLSRPSTESLKQSVTGRWSALWGMFSQTNREPSLKGAGWESLFLC